MTRRRILIVEDNQDAGEMYRLLIELAGHEALLAENGSRGLELLKSAQPDIALVDIGLPGLDGYEVARRFRAEPDSHRVFLVALTGTRRRPTGIAPGRQGSISISSNR